MDWCNTHVMVSVRDVCEELKLQIVLCLTELLASATHR